MTSLFKKGDIPETVLLEGDLNVFDLRPVLAYVGTVVGDDEGRIYAEVEYLGRTYRYELLEGNGRAFYGAHKCGMPFFAVSSKHKAHHVPSVGEKVVFRLKRSKNHVVVVWGRLVDYDFARTADMPGMLFPRQLAH